MTLGVWYVDSGAARWRAERRQDAASELLRWARHLPTEDRVLLEAVFRDGRSVAEVAALTGERPRNLQRRVRELVRRVRSPLFRFVAARGDELISAEAQAVARRRVIEHRPLREIAKTHKLSLYRVRQLLREAESVAGALGTATPIHEPRSGA